VSSATSTASARMEGMNDERGSASKWSMSLLRVEALINSAGIGANFKEGLGTGKNAPRNL
jgi:hypothetical protein